MNIMLLTKHDLEFLSLTRGCTGSSESTHVKMSHCWKSHVMAHMSSSDTNALLFVVVQALAAASRLHVRIGEFLLQFFNNYLLLSYVIFKENNTLEGITVK